MQDRALINKKRAEKTLAISVTYRKLIERAQNSAVLRHPGALDDQQHESDSSNRPAGKKPACQETTPAEQQRKKRKT